MNWFKVLMYSLLPGCMLYSCGTFSSSNKPTILQILPSYANLDKSKSLSGNNSSIRQDNPFSKLTVADESDFAVSLIGLTDINASQKLPILFGQIDYAHDQQLYPLLYSDLDWIIPENNLETPFFNQQVDQVSLGFSPSSYNLQTLQPNNLESALHATALLANRPFFANNISDKEKLASRRAYLSMSQAALKTLYTKNPDLKQKFESAVAFGVFEISNYNVLLYVGGYGKGVIFDNKNKKVIYMYTCRAGTGPGVGYESLYVIFVFKNEIALQQFIGAHGSGGDLGASATLGVLGGQVSFNPEISVYQIYKNGFDLQANWGGTLYLPATNLNK